MTGYLMEVAILHVHCLFQLNTQIQQAPSNDVQCLQEELIAVKLREAEANLSLKEMRQTVSDLDTNWQVRNINIFHGF